MVSHQRSNLTMANENKLKKGPRTSESGCTQASVSERITDEDAIIPTAASVPMAPLPKLFTPKSNKSTGDPFNAVLPMNGDVETAGPAKAEGIAIARPALRIGANAVHDGETASTVTIVSKMVIVATKY